MTRYDIVIIGDIAGLDSLFAEHLLRKYPNLRICLLRKKWGRKQEVKDLASYFSYFDLGNIIYINNSLDFVKYAKSSRLILSIGGAFIGFLRWFYIAKSIINLPPLINLTVGSDFLETTQRKDWFGHLYRNFLNFSNINIIGAAPMHIEVAIKHKIRNVYLMNLPYMLPEFRQSDAKAECLYFFLPSHLDFGITDNDKHRKTHKGNDKFIKAFMRALKSGLNAKCIILDRGADKEIAKELIDKSDFRESFIWKPNLSRNEYLKVLREVDVIVDQFDVGALGMIALEGMSQEKVIITYCNEYALKVQYNDILPPVLNCKTEDEIYEQIIKCSNRDYLKTIGEKARGWVVRNHHWANAMDGFMFHYQRLTGHLIIDYVNQKTIIE